MKAEYERERERKRERERDGAEPQHLILRLCQCCSCHLLLFFSVSLSLSFSLFLRCWGIVKGKHGALQFFRKRTLETAPFKAANPDMIWVDDVLQQIHATGARQSTAWWVLSFAFPARKNPNNRYTLKNPYTLTHANARDSLLPATPGQHKAPWVNLK